MKPGTSRSSTITIRRTPMDTFKDHWKSMSVAGMDICLDSWKEYTKEMSFQPYVIITEVPALLPPPPQIKNKVPKY